MICVVCLRAQEDARLAGVPICLGCVPVALQEPSRLRSERLCSRCHGPVRGGLRDAVTVCFECASAELERAAAIELAPGLASMLPPLDERWRPRRLEPVKLSEDQEREQLAALRKHFEETGRIEPPPPPRKHWLDD